MTIKFFSFLTKMGLLSIVMMLIYASVQQVYRMTANDPQIQTVRDLSMDLSAGRSPIRHFPMDSVDITKSADLFVVIYDQEERPLRSSGFVDGRIPRLPAGVFEVAKKQGEDWVSWEPSRGVRLAMVVAYISSPHPVFVAAGRSLAETENRVNNLSLMVLLAWLAGALLQLARKPFLLGLPV